MYVNECAPLHMHAHPHTQQDGLVKISSQYHGMITELSAKHKAQTEHMLRVNRDLDDCTAREKVGICVHACECGVTVCLLVRFHFFHGHSFFFYRLCAFGVKIGQGCHINSDLRAYSFDDKHTCTPAHLQNHAYVYAYTRTHTCTHTHLHLHFLSRCCTGLVASERAAAGGAVAQPVRAWQAAGEGGGAAVGV